MLKQFFMGFKPPVVKFGALCYDPLTLAFPEAETAAAANLVGGHLTISVCRLAENSHTGGSHSEQRMLDFLKLLEHPAAREAERAVRECVPNPHGQWSAIFNQHLPPAPHTALDLPHVYGDQEYTWNFKVAEDHVQLGTKKNGCNFVQTVPHSPTLTDLLRMTFCLLHRQQYGE